MQAYFQQFQRNYRGLSQGRNLAETRLLTTLENLLANTKKKTWEMMVNQDVDGYTKTPHRRKMLKKRK